MNIEDDELQRKDAAIGRLYSGFLGAELHHGKDDVDAPDELCACVFCGPEELLDILRGEQTGQWFLQDESMPGE